MLLISNKEKYLFRVAPTNSIRIGHSPVKYAVWEHIYTLETWIEIENPKRECSHEMRSESWSWVGIIDSLHNLASFKSFTINFHPIVIMIILPKENRHFTDSLGARRVLKLQVEKIYISTIHWSELILNCWSWKLQIDLFLTEPETYEEDKRTRKIGEIFEKKTKRRVRVEKLKKKTTHFCRNCISRPTHPPHSHVR